MRGLDSAENYWRSNLAALTNLPRQHKSAPAPSSFQNIVWGMEQKKANRDRRKTGLSVAGRKKGTSISREKELQLLACGAFTSAIPFAHMCTDIGC